jgi:hypothetical protein
MVNPIRVSKSGHQTKVESEQREPKKLDSGGKLRWKDQKSRVADTASGKVTICGPVTAPKIRSESVLYSN